MIRAVISRQVSYIDTSSFVHSVYELLSNIWNKGGN